MTLPSLKPACITLYLIVSTGTMSLPLTMTPEIGTPSLISVDEAKEWVETHSTFEIYETLFGEVSE